MGAFDDLKNLGNNVLRVAPGITGQDPIGDAVNTVNQSMSDRYKTENQQGSFNNGSSVPGIPTSGSAPLSQKENFANSMASLSQTRQTPANGGLPDFNPAKSMSGQIPSESDPSRPGPAPKGSGGPTPMVGMNQTAGMSQDADTSRSMGQLGDINSNSQALPIPTPKSSFAEKLSNGNTGSPSLKAYIKTNGFDDNLAKSYSGSGGVDPYSGKGDFATMQAALAAQQHAAGVSERIRDVGNFNNYDRALRAYTNAQTPKAKREAQLNLSAAENTRSANLGSSTEYGAKLAADMSANMYNQNREEQNNVPLQTNKSIMAATQKMQSMDPNSDEYKKQSSYVNQLKDNLYGGNPAEIDETTMNGSVKLKANQHALSQFAAANRIASGKTAQDQSASSKLHQSVASHAVNVKNTPDGPGRDSLVAQGNANFAKDPELSAQWNAWKSKNGIKG